MKRSIAMLLALVLVLALIPAAGAAAPEGMLTIQRVGTPTPVETAKVMEKMQPYGLVNPTDGDYLNYIVPDFETYGLTVVQGEVMDLTAIIGNCNDYDYLMAVLLYEGHYEDLTEDAEPIATGVQETYGVYDSPHSMQWDTTGFAPGDYTVVFCLIDEAGNAYHASMCDVFVSDVEIPMERLGIYVLELGREADTVYEGTYGLTLLPVRYPYHTTERDRVYFKGHAWTGYGAGHSIYGEGVTPNGSDITAYVDRDNKRAFETVLKVLQPEEDNRMWFERIDDVFLCFGAEIAYRLHLPQGASMEEVQLQCSHPGRVNIRVEGDVIYVSSPNRHPGYSYLIASWGDYYACDLFLDQNHEIEEWVVGEATCTQDGLRVRGCVHCGQTEQEWVTPALGHDVADPQVITEPTATKDGTSVGFCARCEQDVELTVSRIFTDTEPDWFYSDALDYCYENGIINGLTASTFGPTATLNRAQLVTMLYRHAGSPAVEGENTFADVPEGQFYTEAVAWASANGIVNGYEDGSFRPGNQITRQEIVTMLYRYVVRLGKDNGQRSELAGFTDLDQLMGYAREPMQWAVANGVINGLSETVLGPQQSANRAQTVTILYRIITGILAE